MSNDSLRRRLDKVGERPCSLCAARTGEEVHVTYPKPLLAGDEDKPLPPPKYCPECGAEIPLTVIRVEYDEE
jgi:hypothetical protein